MTQQTNPLTARLAEIRERVEPLWTERHIFNAFAHALSVDDARGWSTGKDIIQYLKEIDFFNQNTNPSSDLTRLLAVVEVLSSALTSLATGAAISNSYQLVKITQERMTIAIDALTKAEEIMR